MKTYREWLFRFLAYLIDSQYTSFSIRGGIQFPLPFDCKGVLTYEKDILRHIIPHFIPTLINRFSFESIVQVLMQSKATDNFSCATFGSIFCIPDVIFMNYKENNSIVHYDTQYRIQKGALLPITNNNFSYREMTDINIPIFDTDCFDLVYIDNGNLTKHQLSYIMNKMNPYIFYFDRLADINDVKKYGYEVYTVKDIGIAINETFLNMKGLH